MVRREDFPYLQSLFIKDAYAVKNLTVSVFEGSEFKHLILTGGNGSGKTTVLRVLKSLLILDAEKNQGASDKIREMQERIKSSSAQEAFKIKEDIKFLSRVKPFYRTRLRPKSSFLALSGVTPLISYFEASREVLKMREVTTVTTDKDLRGNVSAYKNPAAEYFKQFLVNKKVAQVFDIIDNRQEDAQFQEDFFNALESNLAKVFGDSKLKLEFKRDDFEFYIRFADGRAITFDQLSAGYSSVVRMLAEILLKAEFLPAEQNRLNPCGFVIIDEPETHLHLEMQYQILPWLTQLFPNLQFIVATHSPAVASSIKNATVFDLSTGEVLGDEAAGSSYLELMLTHFGVKNEYSNVADGILKEINRIVAMADTDPALARQQLQALLEEKGRYMSAGLQLEVEAQLAGLD